MWLDENGEHFKNLELAVIAARECAETMGLSVDLFSVEHFTHKIVEHTKRTVVPLTAVQAC